MMEFQSPFAMNSRIRMATLTAHFNKGADVEIILEVNNLENGTSTLSVPNNAPVRDGVYKLTVYPEDEGCCPMTAEVHIKVCPDIQPVAQTDDTGRSEEPYPTCDDTVVEPPIDDGVPIPQT